MRATIWVCVKCGKTSPDRYGRHADTMWGWDVACNAHVRLCYVDTIIRGVDGRAVEATIVEPANPSSGSF